MSGESAQRAVHEALAGMLDDGEIAVGWCLTIDVIGPNDVRYLAHRAGGGADGTENPTAWAALGMLQASVDVARDQIRDCTCEADAEEVDDDGDV